MKKKADRLGTIKMIISSQEIRLQEELMQELQKEGFFVTQATLSRDLKQLKVAKAANLEGNYVYVLPNDVMYRRQTNQRASDMLNDGDDAISLVSLHDVEHINVLQHFVERYEETRVAELPHRVERGRLGLSLKDGNAYGHAVVVGKELRQDVVFPAWREQTEVLRERSGLEFDTAPGVVGEQSREAEILIACL